MIEPYLNPGYYDAMDIYKSDLSKAKAESLPVEYSNGEPVTNVGGKPDSFFEVNGVVEVEEICTRGSCVHSDAGCYAHGMPGETCSARKVARLKPASQGINWPTNGPRSPWEHDDGPINPINPNVAIGWQAGDLPDSIFTREDVRAMMEVAAKNAKVVQIGLRDRILEEFNNITNADNPYQALEWTLDKLGIK